MSGIELIANERKRQIEKEGWDADHDSRHENNELSWAAICYAAPEEMIAHGEIDVSNKRYGDTPSCYSSVSVPFDPWPWDTLYDKRKKHNRLKRLIIAGALIAAEIDLIQANKSLHLTAEKCGK